MKYQLSYSWIQDDISMIGQSEELLVRTYIIYTIVGLAGLWCVSFLLRRNRIVEGE